MATSWSPISPQPTRRARSNAGHGAGEAAPDVRSARSGMAVAGWGRAFGVVGTGALSMGEPVRGGAAFEERSGRAGPADLPFGHLSA